MTIQVLHNNNQANTEKEKPQRNTRPTRYLKILKGPNNQNDVALMHKKTSGKSINRSKYTGNFSTKDRGSDTFLNISFCIIFTMGFIF